MKCPKCKSVVLEAEVRGSAYYRLTKDGWEYNGFYDDGEFSNITCEECGHYWEERIII